MEYEFYHEEFDHNKLCFLNYLVLFEIGKYLSDLPNNIVVIYWLIDCEHVKIIEYHRFTMSLYTIKLNRSLFLLLKI